MRRLHLQLTQDGGVPVAEDGGADGRPPRWKEMQHLLGSKLSEAQVVHAPVGLGGDGREYRGHRIGTCLATQTGSQNKILLAVY